MRPPSQCRRRGTAGRSSCGLAPCRLRTSAAKRSSRAVGRSAARTGDTPAARSEIEGPLPGDSARPAAPRRPAGGGRGHRGRRSPCTHGQSLSVIRVARTGAPPSFLQVDHWLTGHGRRPAAGRTQWRDPEDAMRAPPMPDGRLSIAPPKGVNSRDLLRSRTFSAAPTGTAPRRTQREGDHPERHEQARPPATRQEDTGGGRRHRGHGRGPGGTEAHEGDASRRRKAVKRDRGEARQPSGGRSAGQPRGCGQAFGRHLLPSVVRNFVCCIITGASAPSRSQLSWPRPSRWPTSWLMSICR